MLVDLYLIDLGINPSDAFSYAVSDGFYDGDAHIHSELTAYHERIKPNPDAITVVFTQNEGANRIPLTGWMIAHRMFHTFQSDKEGPLHNAKEGPRAIIEKIAEQLSGVMFDLEHYNYEMPRLYKATLLGSTKACRDFNLTNYGELIPECFAQYMLRGKVTLRPLPETVSIDGRTYTAESTMTSLVSGFADFLNRQFAELITTAKGKIFSL